jgi:polyphosphate kinase
MTTEYQYFNRDLSWLTFNARVLEEANNREVPLLERIKFLSIFSSNLDEFYRVRMPVLLAIVNNAEPVLGINTYEQAKLLINDYQVAYGKILRKQILPDLLARDIDWIYDKEQPACISNAVNDLFTSRIRDKILAVSIDLENKDFFAENNKMYLGVFLNDALGNERLVFIHVLDEEMPRLFLLEHEEVRYVVFLEDIIRQNLGILFPGETIVGAHNIKVTRDAEMQIEDEVDDQIISAMEKELEKRDYGPATRFLCEPGVPLRRLYKMVYVLNLKQASIVIGGPYHNLKDLGQFPISDKALEYPKWPALQQISPGGLESLFDDIRIRDILINLPYEQFDPILRFFKEAATDQAVVEVYCTLYRVANLSDIVQSLVLAAKNGKKVVVMLELKARFDEANNIKWAGELKAAGVSLVYSRSSFKVHAKIALVKRTKGMDLEYFGLLSTGNLNEVTARFYTDHILLTANRPMLLEMEALFGFLAKKKNQPGFNDGIEFRHLLVAQFNLKSKFLELIDREISFAKAGESAAITIKLNNLEEKTLIAKLYEASNAGVKINLIIRSICCLVPDIAGQSENITIKRIVDRFLEHGRVFLFHNNGNAEVYMGSADWMNRNIHSRIEVCFPIYNVELKNRLIQILLLQWNDTAKAVYLDSTMNNVPVPKDKYLRSQEEIYKILSTTYKTGDHENI